MTHFGKPFACVINPNDNKNESKKTNNNKHIVDVVNHFLLVTTNCANNVGNQTKKQLSRSLSCPYLFSRPMKGHYYYHHYQITRQHKQLEKIDLDHVSHRRQTSVQQPFLRPSQSPIPKVNSDTNGNAINLTSLKKIVAGTNNLCGDTTNSQNKLNHPQSQQQQGQQVNMQNADLHASLKHDTSDNNVIPMNKQEEPPVLIQKQHNKSMDVRTRSPVRPHKQTLPHYPHGYEKLYLLPSGSDASNPPGHYRHRVGTKLGANHLLPPQPTITITGAPFQTNSTTQYLDQRICIRLPNDASNLPLLTNNHVHHENVPNMSRFPSNYTSNMIPSSQQVISNPLLQTTEQSNQLASTTVSSGSVIGGSGPDSFFTSQMTAFKIWLQTADERRPPATQLPILLQILLSQSHRIRAMQLLSEFLDLGPWAVAHCLTVGIFPYIVRLFHSPVPEVKPHLVFIWGKIIASAQVSHN
ncbi:unnamed protein product [Trichobilharzia regenti]|nr:unnamed protein product [Trichobilharzia regenti]